MSRSLLVVLLGALMVLGMPMLAAAQSTIDPSIDSDGDGTNNQRDFDDDNDLIVDDADCDPFDASIGRQCPQPTLAPEPTAPPKPASTAPPTSPPPPTSAPDSPTPSITGRDEDSDNDGIANSHDPDDDNDGVTDEQDSAPFDPNAGSKPPPSVIDPDSDSDNDGIANSHDPDDDNDGVTDERDCAPFDATVTACGESGSGPPDGDSGSTGADAGDRPGRGGLFVTTLPTTGAGGTMPGTSMMLMWWIGLTLAGVAIIAGVAVRGLR